MPDASSEYIDVSELRIGHFVYIDLGWLSHPFPLNAFKIHTREQLDTIRALRIDRIRYSSEKSDPDSLPAPPMTVVLKSDPVEEAHRQRRELVSRQRACLNACERGYNDASRSWRQVVDILRAEPEAANRQSLATVRGILDSLSGIEEASIRLLSENAGERSSLHAVNVSVLSLLLGRAIGIGTAEMLDLGLGALLHDIGKVELPNRLRWRDEHFTRAELQIHQEHVAHGITAGRRMGLPPGALLVIAQHHEHADASGYPQGLGNEKLTAASRIVALINHYDNLINPGNPGLGVTPHEALSLIFAQQKSRFDAAVLSSFIRMIGIYPPGSIVQLTDERYALVVSVNSDRPLRPQVIIHQPEIPSDEALVVSLEAVPEIGIRRSLKPVQLPRSTFDYLSPRERVCYYFERAVDAVDGGSVT